MYEMSKKIKTGVMEYWSIGAKLIADFGMRIADCLKGINRRDLHKHRFCPPASSLTEDRN